MPTTRGAEPLALYAGGVSDGIPAQPGSGRRVHWLELFFDLVMVVYVGQVAHGMHGEPGWPELLVFTLLLAAAWWVWINVTLTLNLFGSTTASTWISVTVVMVAVGVMAAAVPEAVGERAWAFAIANAIIRLVWMLPWLLKHRTIGVPWWRPILYNGTPAALWLASVLLPEPWIYVGWVVAIGAEIVLLTATTGRSVWLSRTVDVEHLAERVTLLVVIVFGESVLTIVGELDAHWEPLSTGAAVLAFASVSLLAWVFFRHAAASAERGWHALRSQGRLGALRDVVMYLPFLLVAGVTLFAAGLGTAVAHPDEPLPLGAALCIAGGVTLFYLSSAAEALRYG
ncbi:low temperature requirement protein A, partial [Schumannella luteola]